MQSSSNACAGREFGIILGFAVAVRLVSPINTTLWTLVGQVKATLPLFLGDDVSQDGLSRCGSGSAHSSSLHNAILLGLWCFCKPTSVHMLGPVFYSVVYK